MSQTDKVVVRVMKKSPLAVLPTKAHPTDAGFDLVATSREYDEDNNVVYGCGLAFEIPEGYVGLIFPRSSNAKKVLLLSNSVGVIDCHYRGEVFAKFKITEFNPSKMWALGERFAQLIVLPIPMVELQLAETLSETDRGEGGYGSSDKKE